MIEPDPNPRNRRRRAYVWLVRLACLLYLSVSISEVPDFRALEPRATHGRGGAKQWRFFAEHPMGKTWYELTIEAGCVLAFAADLGIQVSAGAGPRLGGTDISID